VIKTRLLQVDPRDPPLAVLKEAAGVLLKGGLVAFTTETFYGLGARFDNIAALKKLYGIKRRSWNKALPLIIGEKGMLSLVASSVTGPAMRLADNFWPGPLTLLLPARQEMSELITAKTGKIAVRVPGRMSARVGRGNV